MKKLMMIDWVDAASDGDAWLPLKEIVKTRPLRCRSVGWVVKETDHFIHLVPNISSHVTEESEDEGFGGISILKDNIELQQEIEDYNDECD